MNGSDPEGLSSGSSRVYRGGGWDSPSPSSSSRAGYNPSNVDWTGMIGFRLAMTLEDDAQNDCIITFEPNNGDSQNSYSYNNGSSMLVPSIPTREGYMFAGWWTAENGGSQISSSLVVSGDITYYAHWVKNTYSIKFNRNGGGSESVYLREYGVTLGELPKPTREG
jgi:uncharacterized repeat protein (TIGR02543 family)